LGLYSLFLRFAHLFNSMLRHGYVPSHFKSGVILPLVKDHQGNISSPDNYRGITISLIVSKLVENVLLIIFGSFLCSSPWQIGFKKKSSTSHELFCLKECINSYTSKGNDVYVAFLDASKAFDRLVHKGLFHKFLIKGLPLCFIRAKGVPS
jgi:hypothetical protein